MLDEAQSYVLSLYWSLRQQTPPESGICAEHEDPIVSHHLGAMDRAYLTMRAEAVAQARREQERSQPVRRF